jgi:hypothetical protein
MREFALKDKEVMLWLGIVHNSSAFIIWLLHNLLFFIVANCVNLPLLVVALTTRHLFLLFLIPIFKETLIILFLLLRLDSS